MTTRDARLSAVDTLDDVAAQLHAWRAAAGSPSYTEIARRVGVLRAARGPASHAPGRVTVYDSFATGRKRLDVDLVTDIAQVLDIDGDELARWRVRCARAQDGRSRNDVFVVRRGVPDRQMPFVGRAAELEACVSAARPVVIEGMAGIGKSCLARQAMADLHAAGHLEDVVVVALSARSGDSPSWSAISESLLRTLLPDAPVPSGPHERARRLADLLTSRRTGLVLDDVTDPDQVLPLLGAGPRTPVLLTTRQSLGLPGVVGVLLSPWTSGETATLLREVADDARVDADPGSADRIEELVGGLPLAVSLAASRVRDRPDWSLADHVDALEARISARHLDIPVEASIALSYNALPPGPRRTLRFLAAQPCLEISFDSVAVLLGVTPRTARADLAALDRAGCLLGGPTPGRVLLHALVRTFALARTWEEDPPSARDEAISRFADEMVRRTQDAARMLYPGSLPAAEGPGAHEDPPAAARWLDSELDALVQLAFASERSRPRVTTDLSLALSRHFDGKGRSTLALGLHQAAVRAANLTEDPVVQAFAELAVGQSALRLGLPETAGHLLRAQELGRLGGAARPVYAASNALAILAANNGDLREAQARFHEALVLAREDGMTEAIPLLTDNIAVILRRLGDLDGALDHHREALADARSRDDLGAVATSLTNMSEVLLLTGDADGAEAAAREGIDVSRALGDSTMHGYGLANLANALARRGQLDDAVELQREALEYARAHEITALEPAALVNLGEHLEGLDTDAAGRAFDEGLEIATRLDLSFERSRGLHGLARLAAGAGDPDRARSLLRDALAVLGAEADGPEARSIRDALSSLTEDPGADAPG
ncbi:tetratricopeptide repeat protein [Actinotalea sp. BY-33]|uniref:Tetratricopeptide repeat protein n=1 Tax=Actinotalea soli TaxID=2819234 RepID=A0A939LQB8_9CELL|nr:tetratricopeptide repeat protein [Actinotalea soli]MBO1751040.1 tetratricopeptide repeat protein [Actinotalea soli]